MKSISAAMLGLLACAAPAVADEASGTLGKAWAGLNADISLRTGAWTHNRDLDGAGLTGMGEARARIAPRLDDALDFYADGRVQASTADGTQADLVESWLRLVEGPIEIKAGRQIIVWGRADRLNPTDVLGARDYTMLIEKDDEQRLGIGALRLRYGIGRWTLDGYWLPEFRANTFPLDTSRPGVVLLPDQERVDIGQFAAKLDHSGGAIDWSVSFFNGIDRTRDFALAQVPVGSPAGTIAAVQQQYPDIRMFGADMAGTMGPFGYRAEIAYTDVLGQDTEFRKNDNIWAVVGMDTDIPFGVNLNLQYSFRAIFDYSDPALIANPVRRAIALQSAAVNNQLDRIQNGATLRLQRAWLNDTLDTEVSTIAYVETGDLAIRPKVTYAITDDLRMAVGADFFIGPPLSYFGRVRDLSGGYVQLTYGF